MNINSFKTTTWIMYQSGVLTLLLTLFYYTLATNSSSCSRGWIRFGDKCLLFNKGPASYSTADIKCSSLDGNLININGDEEEIEFIKSHLGHSRVYVDYHQGLGEGNQYVQTANLEATKSGKCLTLTEEGAFHFTNCSEEHGFICSRGSYFQNEKSNADHCNFGFHLNWMEDPNTGMCYGVVTYPSTWLNANSYCKDLGFESNIGNLLTIQNPQQQSFIENHFPKFGFDGTYWLGLERRNDNFFWTNETPLSYLNWKLNEPSYDLDHECSYISLKDQAGKWRSGRCSDEKYEFICQLKGSRYFEPPPPPKINDCPMNWIRGGSQCFYISDEELSFESAEKECLSMGDGSRLAIIREETTNSELEPYVISTQVFIGLNDRSEEGNFTWSDGSPLTDGSFNPWAFEAPFDKNHSLNCVALSAPFGWIDLNCNEERRFICSKEYSLYLECSSQGINDQTYVSICLTGVCPSHWSVYNNRCFLFSNEKASCESGEAECAKVLSRSTLVSIHSIHENEFLMDLMPLTFGYTWIGLKKKSDAEEYEKWSDGSEIDFTAFEERDSFQREDQCALLNINGVWSTDQANNKHFFSCSVETTHYMRCRPGWIKSKNSCYLYFEEKTTFSEAEKRCQNLAGNLVQIESKEENDFIYTDIIDYSSFGHTWIGLSSSQINNYFVWNDGTRMTYAHWDSKYPKMNNTSGLCTSFKDSFTGKWVTLDCESKASFICEHPMELMDLPPSSTHNYGCKENQIGYESHCYEMFRTKSTYQQASMSCKYKDGQLLFINNQSLQSRLIPYIFGSNEDFYIALRYIEKSWIWDESNQLLKDFAFWAPNEPKLSNVQTDDQVCVEMIAKDSKNIGMWRVVNCAERKGVICQFLRKGYTNAPVTSTTSLTTLSPSLKCPHGYSMIQNNCYKLVFDAFKRFDEARESCSHLGGDVASFKDAKEEEEVVKYFTEDFGMPNTFIGLIEYEGLSGYRWIDSSIVYGTYTNWAVNEPNCHFNQQRNCVILTDFKWRCSSCLEATNYLCKISPSEDPFTSKPVPTSFNHQQPCHSETLDGWIMFPDLSTATCYKLNEHERVSWFTARKECLKHGGDLVSIHHSLENTYLRSQSEDQEVWIGLNSLQSEGIFEWTDGSMFDFNNWMRNEPSDELNMESCALINSHSLWRDDHCGEQRGFICKKYKYAPSTTNSPSPLPKGHCAQNQAEFEGHCYVIMHDNQNWRNAHASCRGMRSELLSIHNEREDAFIIGWILPEIQAETAWIGASDINQKNTYTWSDESPFDLRHWGVNQPSSHDGSHDENCVFIYSKALHILGTWTNTDCSIEKKFICKSKVRSDISNMTFALPKCSQNPIFVSHLGQCYYYSENKKSIWSEARKDCESKGASLVSIHDVSANSFLTSLSESNSWIGLTSSRGLKNISLIWTDDSAYNYANFFDGEMMNPEVDNCVSLNFKNGKWKIHGCNEQKSYLCAFKETQETTPSPILNNCPPLPGWIPSPFEYCYYFDKGISKTFTEASISCKEIGGSLAGIHSLEENNWITENIPENQRADLNWIGIHRMEDEEGSFDHLAFKWIDGKPYIGGYLNWEGDVAVERGFYGVISPMNGKWSLVSKLELKKAFICNAEKVVPTQPGINSTSQPPSGNSSDRDSSNTGEVISIIGILLALAFLGSTIYFIQKKMGSQIQSIFSRPRKEPSAPIIHFSDISSKNEMIA